MAEQGRIDVLINNAGYAQYGSVEDTSIEVARRQFEVNVFGLAQLTQLVIPVMRDQGAGTIINISSMGGRVYTPMGAWYHATKHALEGWSDCLRLELRPQGIKVIIIEPGAIATEFSQIAAQWSSEPSAPYQQLAGQVARTMADPEFQRQCSPPSLIAETIARALRSPNPRARYAVGHLAKPMMRLRRFGGERLYEKAILSILR